MSNNYQAWVGQYQDDAWSLAVYLLKDGSEAQDATQDAFIKLWMHRHEIDPDSVRPWLMRVVRNGCLDRLRRRRPETNLEDALLDDEARGPLERAAAAKEREAVRAAIANLREPYRTLVILRDVLQYSYADVAGTTELSLSQVKVYLHRARRQLRRELLGDRQ